MSAVVGRARRPGRGLPHALGRLLARRCGMMVPGPCSALVALNMRWDSPRPSRSDACAKSLPRPSSKEEGAAGLAGPLRARRLKQNRSERGVAAKTPSTRPRPLHPPSRRRANEREAPPARAAGGWTPQRMFYATSARHGRRGIMPSRRARSRPRAWGVHPPDAWHGRQRHARPRRRSSALRRALSRDPRRSRA